MSAAGPLGMSLRGWSAWTPGLTAPAAWLTWARGGVAARRETAPPALGEFPPLLRRRADRMGRAALHVLTRPELPYTGQAIVMCSRLGEIGRSFGLQKELASEGSVSPQQFGMSVHHAIGGLFMMAKKARVPLTALAAGEEGALAGLQEAAAQLADGAGILWLLFCEEPLPTEYRSFAASPEDGTDHYAFVLELAAGDEFRLAKDAEHAAPATRRVASPLDLLAFLLCPSDDAIRLSPRGGWTLCRAGRKLA
ncbi:MAG: beta-ketoacyl synthase chain length factor [Candidatus Accumulibacter sp.]|jgi:hypothetical protein|nr:beta-ketoacyl synthase chain length factor [Accumulibacter sp.]